MVVCGFFFGGEVVVVGFWGWVCLFSKHNTICERELTNMSIWTGALSCMCNFTFLIKYYVKTRHSVGETQRTHTAKDCIKSFDLASTLETNSSLFSQSKAS